MTCWRRRCGTGMSSTRRRCRGVARGAFDPPRLAGSDAWCRSATMSGSASFTVGGLGGAEYTIQAWVDSFASWRKGPRRQGAGGPGRLERAARRRRPAAGCGRPIAARAIPRGTRRHSSPATRRDADRETAALDPLLADAASAAADRSRATVLRPRAPRAGGSRARALRLLVRDVSPLGRHAIRAGARPSARPKSALPARRGHGVRRPLPAADPPDRPHASARDATTR